METQLFIRYAAGELVALFKQKLTLFRECIVRAGISEICFERELNDLPPADGPAAYQLGLNSFMVEVYSTLRLAFSKKRAQWLVNLA